MKRDRFPVLSSSRYELERAGVTNVPRSIPWDVAERFRQQAYYNHDQTLERLAERGGLSPAEMYVAACGLGLRGMPQDHDEVVLEWLRSVA